MRKNCLSSNGFVLLEALFCLFLAGFALKLFDFYLTLPKISPKERLSLYPQEEGFFVQKRFFKSSNHLVFEVRQKRLQIGEHVYQSFEILE